MFARSVSDTDDFFPILTNDVIEAVSDRPHEDELRRAARARSAACLIEAFEPENGLEIMLAGQMVVLRSMMLDLLLDARRAITLDEAHRCRQQALVNVRLQLSTLRELDHHRAARSAVAADVATGLVSLEDVLARIAPTPEAEADASGAPRPKLKPSPHPEPVGTKPPQTSGENAVRELREVAARESPEEAAREPREPASTQVSVDGAPEPREEMARPATPPVPILTAPRSSASVASATVVRPMVRTGT